MLSGFKKFILRGNVVDMAVGVVIGAAFAGVVGNTHQGLLTPLIAAIVKAPDFSGLFFYPQRQQVSVWRVHQRHDFVSADGRRGLLLRGHAHQRTGGAHAQRSCSSRSQAKKCPECLSEIPIDARRCAHCAQPVLGKAA